MESNLNHSLKRLLIFIVAYNAESTIESVLKRIPSCLSKLYEVEILIIDDSSKDDTFVRSELIRRAGVIPFKMTVLFNPANQGYGGNQKIGFHYAVKNGFDWVALIHGDGQYAPESLPGLVEILAKNEADAVFGSRMMEGGAAIKGGMPLYKFVGNKILTRFQNMCLDSRLSEFHSGYRLYSILALRKVPFDLNSNDFHFDTEIIIQFIIAKLQIKELPIPTFYGDEICYVNGLKYAWDVFRTTIQARVQKYHIFFDRKFDCVPEGECTPEVFSPFSAESVFAKSIRRESAICIMGAATSGLLADLEAKKHHVKIYPDGLASDFHDCRNMDYIAIFDDAELAQRPDLLLSRLKEICRLHPEVTLTLAVGNIGFIFTRLLLFFGRFSYTKRGIISFGHFRFFTLRSLKKIFFQNGFEIENVKGIPIQYHLIFKSKFLISILSKSHSLLIKIRPSLFGYQFLITVRAKPSLCYLLSSAVRMSAKKIAEIEKG